MLLRWARASIYIFFYIHTQSFPSSSWCWSHYFNNDKVSVDLEVKWRNNLKSWNSHSELTIISNKWPNHSHDQLIILSVNWSICIHTNSLSDKGSIILHWSLRSDVIYMHFQATIYYINTILNTYCMFIFQIW